MCLAVAYPSAGSSEPVLENITHIKLDDSRIQMETLFGQEKVVPGKVVEVDFVTSKVIVELYHTSRVPSDPRKKPEVNTT